VGLLAVTREGGCTRGGKKLPTLYRLTDREAYANPMKHIESAKATNEWKSIATLGGGREAMRKAESKAEINQLRKSNDTASKIEGVRAKTTSKIEVCTPSPTSKIEAGAKSKKGRKANNDAGFKKSADFSDSAPPTSKIEALSTVAIHRGVLGLSSVNPEHGIYRRLTARPTKLFTNLIH
jgi:hypothetical protein